MAKNARNPDKSTRLKWPRLALWALLALSVVSLTLLILGYAPTAVNKGLVGNARADFFANILAVLATVVGLSIAGLLTAEQLDLERDDRAKDRRLSAKRDVLLDAIRGLNKMLAQFSRLASIEIEQNEIGKAFGEGYSQASPALAVADLPTVELLQSLMNDAAFEFIELTIDRYPLRVLYDEAETWDKVADAAHADNQYMFRMQTNATGAGRSGEAKSWSDLFQRGVEQMPAIRKDRDDARDKLDRDRIPFLIHCTFVHRRLRSNYRRLISRVRCEIEVDDDDDFCFSRFDEAADSGDKRFIVQFMKLFPEHHELILEKAEAAGCKLADPK